MLPLLGLQSLTPVERDRSMWRKGKRIVIKMSSKATKTRSGSNWAVVTVLVTHHRGTMGQPLRLGLSLCSPLVSRRSNLQNSSVPKQFPCVTGVLGGSWNHFYSSDSWKVLILQSFFKCEKRWVCSVIFNAVKETPSDFVLLGDLCP